jgi:hypothetical protein
MMACVADRVRGIERIFAGTIFPIGQESEERKLKYGLPVASGFAILRNVSTLAKIQAATESLPLEQQEELYRILGARLHPAPLRLKKARLVRHGDDALLAASSDAPPMTAENVKRMLEEWP